MTILKRIGGRSAFASPKAGIDYSLCMYLCTGRQSTVRMFQAPPMILSYPELTSIESEFAPSKRFYTTPEMYSNF